MDRRTEGVAEKARGREGEREREREKRGGHHHLFQHVAVLAHLRTLRRKTVTNRSGEEYER